MKKTYTSHIGLREGPVHETEKDPIFTPCYMKVMIRYI